LLLEIGHCGCENSIREHHIDGHAQLRFKAAGKTLRPRLKEIDVACHSACIGEKRATLIRQHRQMAAAIEQLHTELSLEICHRLTHHGLSAAQAAAGGRKTALIRGRDECAQLIQ
jgi:hypothetical protein